MSSNKMAKSQRFVKGKAEFIALTVYRASCKFVSMRGLSPGHGICVQAFSKESVRICDFLTEAKICGNNWRGTLYLG